MAEWVGEDSKDRGYWTGSFDLDIFKELEQVNGVVQHLPPEHYKIAQYTEIEVGKDTVFFVNHTHKSYGFINSTDVDSCQYLTIEEALEKITSPEIRNLLLFHLDLFT